MKDVFQVGDGVQPEVIEVISTSNAYATLSLLVVSGGRSRRARASIGGNSKVVEDSLNGG